MTPAIEKHFTVSQIAELGGIGESTVRRLFEDMPGVLRISQPVIQQRKRRPKVTLRVPASLLDRAHEQWSRVSRSGEIKHGRR